MIKAIDKGGCTRKGGCSGKVAAAIKVHAVGRVVQHEGWLQWEVRLQQ